MNALRFSLGLIAVFATTLTAQQPVLHLPLSGNALDTTKQVKVRNHGVSFKGGTAVFDGRKAWLEIPADEVRGLNAKRFTISLQVHTAENLDDVLGDLLSWYDPATREGINLSLMNYSGVTSAQSNWRNVFFGIDKAQGGNRWVDCGRPGTNMQVKSLVVYDGHLYAAVWEPGKDEAGHVYRYAGGTKWVDCGRPDKANAITGLAVYKGQLYAGSELYSGGGSSLPLSPNVHHGGRVYRYEGEQKWTNCGKIADVRSVSGFASYKGKLYAGTGTTGAWRDTPRTRGMYRFDGIGKWTSCGCPGLRVVHLAVHNGNLYGLSYDGGGFFQYEGGTSWKRLGPVPETSQVYATAIYEGQIHAATWPTGSVYRFDGPQQWKHVGRLGEEKEVMGMAVYNGKLYAGTLPSAAIYRYDGPQQWTSTGILDATPKVRYRRAWVTAVFDGKLFCGVLPSGRVLSLEAGKAVSYDRALSAGWHQIVATRDDGRLALYIDGKLVSKSKTFDGNAYRLSPKQPLRIGYGQHDYFNGKMRDLKIYDRALSTAEIQGEFQKTR